MSKRDIANGQAVRFTSTTPLRRATASVALRAVTDGAVERVSCRPGDASCVSEHAATVSGSASGQRSSAYRSLLRLQRQYGNQCVGRVLRQASRGEYSSHHPKVVAHYRGATTTARVQRQEWSEEDTGASNWGGGAGSEWQQGDTADAPAAPPESAGGWEQSDVPPAGPGAEWEQREPAAPSAGPATGDEEWSLESLIDKAREIAGAGQGDPEDVVFVPGLGLIPLIYNLIFGEDEDADVPEEEKENPNGLPRLEDVVTCLVTTGLLPLQIALTLTLALKGGGVAAMVDNPVFIEQACACLSDDQLLQLVRTVVLPGRARKHFEHYLAGSGATLPIDVADLLARNPRIEERIVAAIAAAPDTLDPIQATLVIDQGFYDDVELQFAYGGLDITFRIDDESEARAANRDLASQGLAIVSVSCLGIYEWHPEESRTTQCIHEAAERMKHRGAADFFVGGTARLSLEVPTERIPT